MGYTKERFALDVLLTFVLSGLVYVVSDTFVLGWPYWLCLMIAAGIVFLGELIVAGDGVGSWLD